MTQGPCDYRLFFKKMKKEKKINEKSRRIEQLTEPKLGTKMLSVQVQLCTAIN